MCPFSSPSRWWATSSASSLPRVLSAATTRTIVRDVGAEPAPRKKRQIHGSQGAGAIHPRHAQKSRRVVNEVRGKRVLEAADILRFAPQAVATDVRKVLLSAVANSKVKAQNAGETFNEADLLVLEAYVDEGPTMKRIRPRAQGRAGRILKRTSHITIVVGTKEDKKKGDR